MKKRVSAARFTHVRDVIFQEALEPMEAAVLPAAERMRYGTLNMVPRAFDVPLRRRTQRAKIWVR